MCSGDGTTHPSNRADSQQTSEQFLLIPSKHLKADLVFTGKRRGASTRGRS